MAGKTGRISLHDVQEIFLEKVRQQINVGGFILRLAWNESAAGNGYETHKKDTIIFLTIKLGLHTIQPLCMTVPILWILHQQ